MTDADEVESVLQDRPDLEDPLAAILAVDEDRDRWAFEDVPVDSGPFGELVGRGVVEAVGDEYRLADAAAVRAALDNADGTDAETAESSSASTELPIPSFPRVDRSTALLLAGGVALVVLVRSLAVGTIYRDGAVVLSGNDPYYYRYLVEQAVAGDLPSSALSGEPLLVVVLTAVAELFGGSVAVVGHVLAWYPVATAVVAAVLVYLLAVTVTEDRRVALAAVFLFAVLPGHAFRTGVGFADHHAFDYIWLALTALAVTHLATVDRAALRERRTVALVAVAAAAIAAQILAWEAAPLLLLPIPILVAVRAAIDVSRERSPLPAGLPLVAALGLGSALTLAVHIATGLQSTTVAIAPAVLAVGAGAALALAIAGHRRGWQAGTVLAGYGGLGVAGLIAAVNGPAALRGELVGRLGDLFRSGGISETQSIFSPESLGFLTQFGSALVLALPAMALALGRARSDGRWLALSTYAWFFLALAALQMRFVGELAAFVAVFAGWMFVWLATRLGVLAERAADADGVRSLRRPSPRTALSLLVLLTLLGGYGAVQAQTLGTQVAVDDYEYDTARALAAVDEERDHRYPENYVLSDWSDNRVYNYYVSGNSGSYLYAQDNYTRFAGSTSPDSWYDRLSDRVGYVVLAPAVESADRQSAIWRLTREYGSATADVPGVAHYRVLYVPPSEGRVAVEVVPGATLTGTGEPGTNVTVDTVVDRPSIEFPYQRRTTVAADGTWEITVANPGTYNVSIGNRTTTADVTEAAVLDGTTASTG